MERLQLLWVTRSDLAPSAGVKRHDHPYYHMFHIVKGNFCFFAGDQKYNLLPGSTILVPPHVEHGYSNETDQTFQYMEIKFTLAQPYGDKNFVPLSNDPLVASLFDRILQEYSDLGNLADEAANAYLNAILNILYSPQRYAQQPRPFRHVDASGCSELSQQIIRYLEDHYSQDLSLDTLAQSMGYNKSYLCVAFKKDTRQTIVDCLNMIRIRRAAELIVYSDHSLAQVSALCGFSSVSHFNRVFLKYAGTTPGQCRRAYPANILFGFPKDAQDSSTYFMYSVLAQKRITLEELNKTDD